MSAADDYKYRAWLSVGHEREVSLKRCILKPKYKIHRE